MLFFHVFTAEYRDDPDREKAFAADVENTGKLPQDGEPVLISRNEAIREIRSRITLVARSEAAVLVTERAERGRK